MGTPLCIHHIDLNYVNLRPAYIRAWLRRLADMGYNAVLWELEDKVRWEACPEAVWPEAMSKAELGSLLDEAARLGLESIPLLQTVGHGEYILKHDAYRHMREVEDRHDCYCTEKPEVRAFLKRLIGEYLDVFGPISRFHLGGDEAYVFARCPVCSRKAELVGRNALYAEHILDLSAQIRERGIRAGIWCDMVLNHPEQMGAIPKSLEMWDWNYWDTDGPVERVRVWGQGHAARSDINAGTLERFPEILDRDGNLNPFYTAEALQRMGYEVILCSAARSAGDSVFCPRTRLHAANIAGAARKTAVLGLAGTCVTDWAIRLNGWETHSVVLPLAPAILADPKASLEEALLRTGRDTFGCDPAGFLEAVELVSGAGFPFSQARSTAVQWNGLKDSSPAPAGYIASLLREWDSSGRLREERAAIPMTIERIARGCAMLSAFASQAVRGLSLLQYWTQAAWFQLWQARMAREMLEERRGPENAQALRSLKAAYERFLLFDHTPASAAQNSGLVYDALIEYME